MRKLHSVVIIAFVFFVSGCNGSESSGTKTETSKVTEIPATTSNKEAEASFRQALGLFDQGDGLEAKELFARAIQQDPNLAIAHLYNALTSVTPKEFNDELATAKMHLDSASNWEKNYYEYVLTFNSNDNGKRKEVLQKIADEYPDAARAHLDLGAELEAQNDYANARAEYEKAMKLNDKWIAPYNLLATSYVFSAPKDFKKAEEMAVKAAGLAPNSAGIQILLGDVYRAQNDLEKARTAYAKAIELKPQQPNAYYKRGHVNSFLGNMDEARKDYAQGGKLDQTNSLAILQAGYTYLYAGDSKAAVQYLMTESGKLDTAATNLSKNNLIRLNIADNIARIAFHTGDTATLSKAIGIMDPLEKSLNAEVGTSEAKIGGDAALVYMKAALEAIKGNYSAAESLNEEMKKMLDPVKNSRKLESYEFIEGYLAFKQNKAVDAVAHFEKADQNDVYVRYWLAKAYEASGNKDKAKTIFDEVSIYNFNNLGYALVRNELKKKA